MESSDNIQLSEEDVKSVVQEIHNEEIGDLNSDEIIEPSNENKAKLSALDFSFLSDSQVNNLLHNLSGLKIVNPNGNKFSDIDEKSIRRTKLKQRLREMREQRQTNTVRKSNSEKNREKLAQILNERNDNNDNNGTNA